MRVTFNALVALFLIALRQSAAFLRGSIDAASRSNRYCDAMMRAAIKGVLFDKDGTLIDFDSTFGPATAAVIRDLAQGDSMQEQALAQAAQFDIVTNKFHPQSVVLAGSVADIASDMLPVLTPTRRTDGDAELEGFVQELDELFRKHSLSSLSAFRYTASTLSELNQRGLKLGIATNDSEAAARQHMAQLELDHFFDKIWGFDSGYGAKPEPGMVAAFADVIRAERNQVMMVGDTLHDCEAGRNAGAIVVGVESGLWSKDHLAPHADHVLSDISELPALVDRLGGAQAAAA